MATQDNIYVPIRYIKMYVQVKRNGKIIHYCTTWTRFENERAIQT